MATIIFNSENHTYLNTETNKYLISTTQLLRKHGLSPDYSQVNEDVLKQAAQHGTFVHSELETYAKEGLLGVSEEFDWFIEYKNKHPFEIVESEWQVYNDIVAGTIDCVIKIGEKYYLVDYKTTTNKNIESVSWQLSVYKALQTKYKIEGLIVFHFKKDGLEVLEIKEKPQSEVEKLFECERKGELYRQELIVENQQIAEIVEVENLIIGLESQLKLLKEKEKELSDKIVEAMENQNCKKFETDNLVITYKAPFKRKGFDSKRFEKEHAELYKEYEKENDVKATVLIKLKNEWKLYIWPKWFNTWSWTWNKVWITNWKN